MKGLWASAPRRFRLAGSTPLKTQQAPLLRERRLFAYISRNGNSSGRCARGRAKQWERHAGRRPETGGEKAACTRRLQVFPLKHRRTALLQSNHAIPGACTGQCAGVEQMNPTHI